ncbi:MAG TPA: amino acid adenylation domain-containing protein, partial [Longimicrobiaceae bacterium]|nr:amino acid adenylation domain-containing protein [Longimicrobiaceae bacterium]
LEGLIGFFVNTLALRTDLSGDPTPRALVRRARETVLGAQAHGDVPFERLVEELAPERSLRHTPLFQVLFALQNQPRETLRLGALDVESLPPEGNAIRFDLEVSLAELGDEVRGVVGFRTSLFDASTVARLASRLGALLAAMGAGPDRRLSDADLLGPDERARVLGAWNDTARPYPPLPAHLLFARQAARTPDTVAVLAAAGPLTYAELDARADALAARLRGLGVGPEVPVGLCVERTPEMVVGVLGIWKAGGAYVPLDPAYPAERLELIARDAALRVVVASAEAAGVLPELGGGIVVATPLPPAPSPARGEGENDGGGAGSGAPDGALTPRPPLPILGEGEHDTAEGGERQHGDSPPPERGRVAALRPPGGGPHADPDNLAYVIYTSGSTGRPKGVALPHRALVNLLRWQDAEWRHPEAAATLQFTTVGFDVSFQEIFSCWLSGGRLVLLDEDERRDLGAVLERLESAGVERLFLPYVALQHLAELGVERGVYPSALTEVQTAGEQLRVTEPIRRWLERTGAALSNQYGPSETHVATAQALEGAPGAWPLLPGIGRPIANARCYVLDARGEPAPIGAPGELHLAGACLARGYLGRPELTAERFVPDPFAGEPGARAYRTGDRARWLAGGTLEFLGRADAQVKVRGHRVEPGEVEAALESHPTVRQAVATVRGDAAGQARLVAYMVPEDGRSPRAAELRAHVGGRLPEYMVPSAVVVLDGFPLTPSGKVDRRALPEPDASAGEGEGNAAPETPTEEILAGIFAAVLGVAEVGARDDFFAMGGHSLLATRVVSRVRGALGLDLPLREVFEAPAVRGLSERVDALLRAGAAVHAPPLVPAPRVGPLPLSFAQQRLW